MPIQSKAISPMIATVLLIAFTVAVGGILSLWLTSMTSTQTETTGMAADIQILCVRSVLIVSEVDYKTTASANVTVKYNYGTEALSNVNVFFVDSKRASYNKSQTGSLTPGSVATYAVTATGLTGIEYQNVKVVAMCHGNYPIIGECKTGQACMAKRSQ